MLDMSEIVLSPEFQEPVIIQRSTNGHFEGPDYKSDTAQITVYGVVTNPKGTVSIGQTDEGSRATGYISVYTSADTPLYITQDKADGNDISDVILRPTGLNDENGNPAYDSYTIYNIENYSRYGYWKAEAVRTGAI